MTELLQKRFDELVTQADVVAATKQRKHAIIGVGVKIKDRGKNSLLSALLHAAHLLIKKQPENGPKC